MFVAFNIVVSLLVVLIAYWWANQGLLSAFLHLLCVITAGAIAFALWEPLTVNFLLRGNTFDNYAWGITLVGVFAVALFLLRLASDKLVAVDISLPKWVNYAVGFPIGTCAGVISMGIVMIGGGFVQSHSDIAGYRGWARSQFTGEIEYIGPSMWLPVHHWTGGFYQWLSVGALYPEIGGSMLHYNPDLHKQATLLRDTYASRGRHGQIALYPNAAEIRRVQVDEQANRYAVEVEFGPLARDFGRQLILSSSQVRLIGRPRSASSAPAVVHPDHWQQEVRDQGGMQRFAFDDTAHYVTSVAGQQRARVIFEFSLPQNNQPRFIQIRGTRYEMPSAEPVPAGSLGRGMASAPSNDELPPPTHSGARIDDQIELTHHIHPVFASTNRLPGTISHEENYLTEGHGIFRRDGDRPSMALRVRGIHEPTGTRVVQLDVSRGLPTDIFGELRRQVGRDGRLALIDDRGNRYEPMGFIHEHREGITIRLEPARLLGSAEDIPSLPSAGGDRLRLLFQITEGVTIRSFQYGNVTVGTCNLHIEPRRQR